MACDAATELLKTLYGEVKRRIDEKLSQPLELLIEIVVIGAGKESTLLDSNLNR